MFSAEDNVTVKPKDNLNTLADVTPVELVTKGRRRTVGVNVPSYVFFDTRSFHNCTFPQRLMPVLFDRVRDDQYYIDNL
ncbi:hypothetical protein BaRGS_00034623 [Batillaria attramentaria]|uniref:Uncharacterized protein n=1 Tax=Batillaria attramentaria TaxID=370345 RepID=A0ABD0JH23_9CAEN